MASQQLTKRETIALAALQGLLASGDCTGKNVDDADQTVAKGRVVCDAFELADAFLGWSEQSLVGKRGTVRAAKKRK